MQRVGLDEDEEPVGPGPSGPQRLRQRSARVGAWAVRRPVQAALAAATALALAATVVVGVPRWSAGYERAAVLGAVAFPGAVRVLDEPPRARWSAAVDGAVAPVLVGDVVVVAAGSADVDRRLLGLDVVTGATRWSVPLGAALDPQTVLCRGLDERLVCVVGPPPPSDRRRFVPDETDRAGQGTGASTLLALDPRTGVVLAHHRIEGWTVATAAAGSDLVVATYAWGMVTVRRLDPTTAAVRWETQRWTTFQSAGNSQVRLVAAGGLVTAVGNEVSIVLDARTGERLPRRPGASVADETRLLDDGTLVRVRYRSRGPDAGAVSELSTGSGGPWVSVRGALVVPGASDGTSGLVFTASGLTGGPLAGRVRAFVLGDGEPAWRALTPAPEVAVDAADRVVLRGSGALVGLDAASGEQLWRVDLAATSIGRTFTDGEHVLVEHRRADGATALLAVALADGSAAWQVPLPADAPRVQRLGTHLYALGDHLLVALR